MAIVARRAIRVDPVGRGSPKLGPAALPSHATSIVVYAVTRSAIPKPDSAEAATAIRDRQRVSDNVRIATAVISAAAMPITLSAVLLVAGSLWRLRKR